MKRVLFLNALISLLIFATGCTPGKISALKMPDPGQAPLCEPGQSKGSSFVSKPFVSSFEKAQTKIFSEEFTNPSQAGKFSLQNEAVVLNKNSQIIIYANRNCVLGQSNPNSLSAQIKNQVRPVTKLGTAPDSYFGLILNQAISLKDLEAKAKQDPCVIGVSPNQKLEMQSTPNDPLYPIQNDLTRINHSLRYDKIMNEISEEVLVAVVDSGNDQVHPDMTDRHWRNSAEQLGIAGVDDDGNGFIDDIYGYSWACYLGGDRPTSFFHMPHGEHVAGIIAANANNNEGIVGIAAQKAKMMHLNVIYSGSPLGCGGGGTGLEDLVNAVQAIQYAADNGAKVINISMGKFGRSTPMKDVMEYAVSKGAFIAAAAGNNNKIILDTEENFFYPCAYSKEIEGFSCVAATDANPAVENTRCVFSNFSNEYVELSAPGCDSSVGQVDYGLNGVLSTVRATDTPAYKYMPGTSMASPHIAAAAALVVGYIKTKRRTFPSPAEVEDVLRKGSRLQSNLETSVQGGGRTLDLDALFQYMDDILFPTPPDTTPPEECS